MNKQQLIVQPDTCYRLAEQKAAGYFASLYEQVKGQSYAAVLSADIRLWKRKHIRRASWLSLFSPRKNKPDSSDYSRYIQWLTHTGRLDAYLDRSVTYMYMRDLGKAPDAPDAQAGIRRMAAQLKQRLIHPAEGERLNFVSTAWLYRWARKEGVEEAAIWLIDKLKNVAVHIPQEMNAEHAQRKLMKIIMGVVLHAIEEMNDETPPEERVRRLDAAIRLGYSYGLTYPFVDDLLDAPVLTAPEKEQYGQMIRTALLTGSVPELGELEEWDGAHKALIMYVHAELRDAFHYIQQHQRPETRHLFFEQAYVFFHAQELDRGKELSHDAYTNEELYLPVILKSASSRLVARSVLDVPADEGFEERTFYYGIYNQLADDFADMLDDRRDGAVTPYTYYMMYRERRPDLINPFELYWAVIAHLIHHVYRSDANAREIILDRAINGLKRCRARIGDEQYSSLMDILASGHPAFRRLVQHMVNRAEDVDFFDKLLRDQVVAGLQTDRKEREQFFRTIQAVREQINHALPIAKPDGGVPAMKESLIEAANYSLEGDGKRLRPIVTWVMGVHEYGLSETAILPLLKSLEYMHTASLIFDDLPSQDNAPTRRGRPTLHRVHDSATAELTGLFLIQRAIREQATLERFDAKDVLALMRYSAEKAEDICMGQAMDLNARGKELTLEQLNTICFYKTGVVFEAALVMPAILARAGEEEIARLKAYAYHAGIAFQIKDDLLDVEGDARLLGKPVGKDAANNSSTFVSILGQEGARKEMWEHYCRAMEELQKMPRPRVFLKHLLDYMINREG
ncbi:Geranylgeranyl pyrophosphate synthase [Paenibacillus sp. UNCCL117]|uniref:polyprenyl synthetase family protein n=1 Tax=unclassified Paenibacillus TaxID=185978 RepID=UPI000889E0FA|nr:MULTISPECIES: polyprenyl synthetase family protein [unclassified Paenibacillus]SDD49940.1 Geranylgeranyl pyrophosphate synthase [Paenibacillus sp. cl123]SFW49831.1 Geranylgeranyl pyrophosphate synthase [Paenibacillus sp. UNCCL117]